MSRTSYAEHVDASSFGPHALDSATPELRSNFCDRLVKPGQGPLRDASFLNAVLDLLRAVLQPKLMFLGMLTNGGKTVNTCLAFQNGGRIKNFSYALADSPCATVLGPQSMCIYPDEVASLFPLDRELRRLGAMGYVGMPLLSRSGEQIGIIAAITAHPIANLDEVRSAFQLFGSRLSLELELAISGEDEPTGVAEAMQVEERRIVEAVQQAS